MQQRTKIYFISDIHLGIPPNEKEREQCFVNWLDEVKADAQKIFLLGDIFDFWFSYKHVVPRGYVRVLGKLAELTDSGIEIHYAIGNHDMWIFDYFEKELGIKTYTKPWDFAYNGKTFLVGHGDGLGKSDKKYNFLKILFSSKICQKLFASLHPYIGISLANFCSKKSRFSHSEFDARYFGDDKEDITVYCNNAIKNKPYDYCIFGHRHLVLNKKLGTKTRYINLGEWVNQKHYAVYDGNDITIKEYKCTPQTYKTN